MFHREFHQLQRMNEVQLFELYLDAGCEDAFEELTVRLTRPIINFLISDYRLDHATAEDILQETWIKVILNQTKYRRGTRVEPWVYTIAANTARDYLRYRGSRPCLSYDVIHGAKRSQHDKEPYRNVLPDPKAVNPAEQVDDDGKLENIINGMKVKDRDVAMLVLVEGHSYKQVSTQLNLSIGTISSRMNRIRKKLQHRVSLAAA